MAGPVKSVADKAAGSFMDTLKGIGTDKVVSEALLGGAAGIGLNLGANVVTGDSGGYTGAAMLGGAAGGLGRAGLKHFNLETQASNLFSTAKGVATGGMTKAQKTMGTKNNKPVGERLTDWRGNSLSIDAHANEERKYRAIGESLNTRGYPESAAENFARADAFKVTGKDLRTQRWEQSGQTNPTPERQSMTPSQIQQQRYSPEAKKLREDRRILKQEKARDSQSRSDFTSRVRGDFDQRQLDRIDMRSKYKDPQKSTSTSSMSSQSKSIWANRKTRMNAQQQAQASAQGSSSQTIPMTTSSSGGTYSKSLASGIASMNAKNYGPATF